MKKYILTIFMSFSFVYAESFDDVLSKALENDLVKSKEYEVRSFEGELLKARSLQNPQVYTEFGRLISKGSSSFNLTEFSISQPLYLYGIRSYKVKEAMGVVESAKYNFEMFINEYKSEVYKLFYESLYKKEVLNVAKQELEFSKNIYDFVKKTYDLGEISKVDFLRSEKDYSIAKINYEKSQADYVESLKRLSSFVGFDVLDVEGDFYDVRSISQIDFSKNPEVKFYLKSQEVLSSQEGYFKALAKPQISVGFITKEASKNIYESGFFVSATLPVFYRYTGELVSIRNKKLQYENLVQYTVQKLQLKYESIYKTQESLKQQLFKIDKEVFPTLEKQLQLAEKSYKLKVITLFELTSIKNDYFQTLKYKLELLDALHKNYSEYIKIGGQI
ncbi:TolC family protein [Sulfurihydrogenibium sp.]|uniref:TolC family protein n=1 Tax=Sulfurihydrogenibium sp. TaxID=2053621 RepID=UPI00261BEA74|nr:TolC family protein [Sulfurihydrogenibium sp.]